jgi:hypothetical protein
MFDSVWYSPLDLVYAILLAKSIRYPFGVKFGLCLVG